MKARGKAIAQFHVYYLLTDRYNLADYLAVRFPRETGAKYVLPNESA
jgi:hypothetical protein